MDSYGPDTNPGEQGDGDRVTPEGRPGQPRDPPRAATELALSSRIGDIFDDEVPHPTYREIGDGDRRVDDNGG